MDFNGRVKLASKKNFQLVDINNDKEKDADEFWKGHEGAFQFRLLQTDDFDSVFCCRIDKFF